MNDSPLDLDAIERRSLRCEDASLTRDEWETAVCDSADDVDVLITEVRRLRALTEENL